jgi:hypothetical protein
MTGERTTPGLGLTAFWEVGSDGWGDQMDANLRTVSGVAQLVVKSKDTALPGTPSLGDIYLVPSDDATNPGKIAIWDGPVGTEAWVYVTPTEGWMAYVTDLADTYRFESSGWNVFSSGAGGGGAAVAQYAVFGGDDLPNLTPVLGGGMILRNSAYTGPAIRVADNTTTDEIDVEFDASGRVAGARPYGANTRLVRVYDQWGTDDFIAAKTDGVELIENDDSVHYTWRIDFANASTGLFTASLATENPVWKQEDPFWAIGYQRVNTAALESIHGADGSTNYMAVGVWQEANDLHWRVDNGAAIDWTGTDWTADAPASQAFSRLIGDMTGRDATARAYFNGTAAGTRGYTDPVDGYQNGSRYGWGDKDGLGSPASGSSTELHVFSSTGAVTAPEVAFVDSALAETQTDPAADVATSATPYDLRFGFGATPSGGAVLETVMMVRDVALPANLAGSLGLIAANPTSAFAMSLQDDDVEIATITVATDGSYAFATTDGAAQTVVAGSVLTLVAPASADASAQNAVVTVAGAVQ